MKDKILNTLMLLTVAAALGITLLRGPGEESAPLPLPDLRPAPTLHPAQVYRQRRSAARQEEEAALAALIQQEETRDTAQTQLQEMVNAQEIELAIEGALAGKGYPNGLCVYRKGRMTVFVDGQINSHDAALLSALAAEIANISPENIRITGY